MGDSFTPANTSPLAFVPCRADRLAIRARLVPLVLLQAEKPERAINADPKAWYRTIRPDLMGEEAYADLMTAIHSPAVIHRMIEDYRAGLTVDRKDELQDRAAGRRIARPLLGHWSTRDDLEYFFGDPREIWRLWATNVTGHGIDSGHHVAEENPADLANSLQLFSAMVEPLAAPGGVKARNGDNAKRATDR
ncbi:hypothetical protein GGE46_003859 [Rhizobium etli]|uniref:Uncharacterized protein n=1 Tax=Rhizobium etli TaxID=29449 RepID=A0A7W7EG04_RHIET|nr:hypothetical protein [Rhizobium etli]MBB4537124.1 hypothetical protein [Rhizobium etli]